MTRKDGLASVLLGLVIAVSLAASAWLYVQFQMNNQKILCASARYNHEQLIALAKVSRNLGIPRGFEIPEVPQECDGS
jgi:hypothetical protein